MVLAGELRKNAEGECQLVHPSNVTAMVTERWGNWASGHVTRWSRRSRGAPWRSWLPPRWMQSSIGWTSRCRSRCARSSAFRGSRDALCTIHRPASTLSPEQIDALAEGRAPAQQRFAFEELLVLQLGLARERSVVRGHRAFACDGEDDVLDAAKSALPFVCTAAQERAIADIASGLRGPSPMQCLLQGDVGSGKTAVVFAACALVARAGGQSLLMAPTAVLAEQHHRSLTAWGKGVGLRTSLLHAGLSTAEQIAVLDAAASGEADVIVGTHALLEDRLRLRRLALAIVDEQHRFGVRQRARLRRRTGEGKRLANHRAKRHGPAPARAVRNSHSQNLGIDDVRRSRPGDAGCATAGPQAGRDPCVRL